MPELFNYNKSEMEFVPENEVQDAILSRRYTFPTDAFIAVRDPRDPDGQHFIPGVEARRFFKNGYIYVPAGIRDQEMLKQEYGDAYGQGFGVGMARSVPFLGDWMMRHLYTPREYQGIKDYAPGTTAGEITGTAMQLFGPQAAVFGPLKGMKGLSLAKNLAGRAVSSGTVSRAAQMAHRAGGATTRGVSSLAGRGVALGTGRFVEGAVDAGIYEGAHVLNEEMFGDPEELGQGYASRIGIPALLGGSLNVVLPVIGKALLPLAKQTLAAVAERATGKALNTRTMQGGRAQLEKEMMLRNSQEFEEISALLDGTNKGAELRARNELNNYDYDATLKELKDSQKDLELELAAIKQKSDLSFHDREKFVQQLEESLASIDATVKNLEAQKAILKPKFDAVRNEVKQQYDDIIQESGGALYSDLNAVSSSLRDTQAKVAQAKAGVVAEKIDGDNFIEFFEGSMDTLYNRQGNQLRARLDNSEMLMDGTPVKAGIDAVIDRNVTGSRIDLINAMQAVKAKIAVVNPRLAKRLDQLHVLTLKLDPNVKVPDATMQKADAFFEEFLSDPAKRQALFGLLDQDVRKAIKQKAFMRADSLKKGIADVLFNMSDNQISRNAARGLRSLAWRPLQAVLENEKVYGEAAQYQKELNPAFSSFLDSQDDFYGKFGQYLSTDKGNVVESSSIKGFARDLVDYGSDTQRNMVNSYLDNAQNFLDVIGRENIPGVSDEALMALRLNMQNARKNMQTLTETGQMQKVIRQMTGRPKLGREVRGLDRRSQTVNQVREELRVVEEQIASRQGLTPSGAPVAGIPGEVVSRIRKGLDGDKAEQAKAMQEWRAELKLQELELDKTKPPDLSYRPGPDERIGFGSVVTAEMAGGAGYALGGYEGSILMRLGVLGLSALLKGGNAGAYKKFLVIYDQSYKVKMDAKDSIKELIDAGITSYERALANPLNSMRSMLGAIFGAEYVKEQKDLDDFTVVSNGLNQLYYNDEIQTEMINKATVAIADDMPRTAMAIQNQLARGVGYLHSQMPKQPARDYGAFRNHTYQPAEGALRKFQRAIEVVLEPHKTTTASLRSGIWTSDMTVGLRATAPLVYAQWTEAINEISWDQQLDYQNRLLFETFLGKGQEPTRRRGFVDTMNAIHGAPEQLGTKPDPSAAALKPLAKDTQTFAMRRSGGGL